EGPWPAARCGLRGANANAARPPLPRTRRGPADARRGPFRSPLARRLAPPPRPALHGRRRRWADESRRPVGRGDQVPLLRSEHVSQGTALQRALV
ncbi:MAG: hypothetical protein AVDCRST_MAG89-2222, partial [uncultured Gemmatimonadetes bacterium]